MSGANARKFWRVEAEGVPLADLFFLFHLIEFFCLNFCERQPMIYFG